LRPCIARWRIDICLSGSGGNSAKNSKSRKFRLRGDERLRHDPEKLVPDGFEVPTVLRQLYGNFKSKNHTKIIKLLVSFSIPKFAKGVPQDVVSFGIGTPVLITRQ
jgi:hypothetical protein